MAGLWSGEALNYLASELKKRGVILNPKPDRPIPGRKPIENPRLVKTFRSFLTHVKNNQLTMEELHHRLRKRLSGNFIFRHRIFLELFEKIRDSWEEKLKEGKYIDFEDMLGLASDCIEQGRWGGGYRLIMVDEFQDVSQSRARLIACLLKGPGKHLFAVGDDWQSINRFAGSDLSVMTDFEEKFGRAVTLKLENTYRCPQSICDISSMFIQKNNKQIAKKVKSVRHDVVNPVRIIQVDDENSIQEAVANRIKDITSDTHAKDRISKIFILGRYKNDKKYFPAGDKNKVEFVTVHSSKGLEADHVIIPRMTSDIYGFPSRIEDDPVLQLAMPGGDSFEYAEERRLFYVALTRAKSTVTVITLPGKQSSFVTELIKDHQLEIYSLKGTIICNDICPECKTGHLVQKSGKYGLFIGCNTYPRCKYTENIN
jgi:DNA helicase-4